MVRLHKLYNLYVAAMLGAALVLCTYLLTRRSVDAELERWSALGHSLTTTTERCVALLPQAWTVQSAIDAVRSRGMGH